jgi:hypothetical protein
MSMDWNKLKEFLRNLGVEWGSEAQIPQIVPEEPFITVLQRSHDHEAFYRLDWLETGPEMLVLLPNNQMPLRFSFYLVKLSETHPLREALTRVMNYQGSEGFEQERSVAEWHLLQATAETMKALFWAGQETSQFPSEIMVQKIG